MKLIIILQTLIICFLTSCAKKGVEGISDFIEKGTDNISYYTYSGNKLIEFSNVGQHDNSSVNIESQFDSIRDFEIKNSVQRDLCLQYILREFKEYNHTDKHSKSDDYFNLLNMMPPIGYQLPIKYESINLKYNIPCNNEELEAKYQMGCFKIYRISIPYNEESNFVYSKINKSEIIQDSTKYNQYWWVQNSSTPFLKKGVIIARNHNSINKHKYIFQLPSRENHNDNFIIAVRNRAFHNFGPVPHQFDILFLSKDFISYNWSKRTLYNIFIHDLPPTSKQIKEVKYEKGDTLYRIKKRLPYKGDPRELIPFIYIMSWSDYEPEDVLFDKKIGSIFYYTFYSIKKQKHVRLKYNARTINFDNYKYLD